MSNYIEKIEEKGLPAIATRGVIGFPSFPFNFELEREISINALKAAESSDSLFLAVCQRDLSIEKPSFEDLYSVGTICEIKQTIKTEEGTIRVFAEPLSRANVKSVIMLDGFLWADVIAKTVHIDSSQLGLEAQALIIEAVKVLERTATLLPPDATEIVSRAKTIKNPGQLADYISSCVLLKYEDKQTVLEVFEPVERLETLIMLLEKEFSILELEFRIHKRVKEALDERQKEFYLREQLKVIEDELEETDDEIAEYYEKIQKSAFPDDVKAKLKKELSRLEKFSIASPDSSVYRNYLDTCLDMPLGILTEDTVDIEKASAVLDSDHYGLKKPKERILEYLAVKQLNPDLKNQIICFVGPPGTGKTSIAKSIATAMNRSFVRVSLGGIRDEAEIRGHRKTYVAAMPGRIVNALIKAGTMNPVMCLDEIDKLCSDMRGDPAAAMLEVLDAEQNKTFRDHFLEFECDLSNVLFICTANDLSTVPRALLDRMEIIELNTYTKPEKVAIASNHLIPKQLSRHGLTKSKCKFTKSAIDLIIDGYTAESGVRNLEREIATVCRKVARKLVEEDKKSISVSSSNLESLLGPRKFMPDKLIKKDLVGVVNGLAYTSVGGDVLKVETAIMDGTGKLELTGTLGDVMKESAKIAVSYIRSNYNKLSVNKDFYKNKDIHLHVPEGATPKDGPSAGVTILTSFVSALTGKKVRHDFAMTGEITLTGRVLPIGGLKEKSTAAWNMGIKNILIPADNKADISELDDEVKSAINFITVNNVSEVIDYAIIK